MRTLAVLKMLGLALFVCWVTPGCKFMPNRPYWIEAHGSGQGQRISAWPNGALLIGVDSRLYRYPGVWARPWLEQSAQQLRALSASQKYIYALLTDGRVARFAGGSWTPFAGSAAWKVSEIAATEGDRVLVVADGKVRKMGNTLEEDECPGLTDVVTIGARDEEVFVVDRAGVLHRGLAGRCAPIDTPVPLRRIAAIAGRVLGVGVDGTVWRLRGGDSWAKVGAPIKYRPGRVPFATKGRDVALSSYSTWLLDDEGSVFVLSDES